MVTTRFMGGKEDKAIARLKLVPADFTWAELTSLLEGLGFVARQGSGSRVKFVGPDDIIISLHRPHPGNEVKRCYLRDLVAKLKEAGLIK